MERMSESENALFRCSIKVRRGQNCDLPPQIRGAFVECYIAAVSHLEGLRLAVGKLQDRGYIFDDVVDQKIDQLDPMKWDLVKNTWPEFQDNFPSQVEIFELMRVGGVLFGPFICWEGD